MRRLTLLVLLLIPAPASAQLDDEGGREAEEYVALSADQRAQLSIGGFREYLERTREEDERLYEAIDPRLSDLESRELAADVIFWTATGLGVAAVAAGIPVYTEFQDRSLADLGIGLMIGGASTFLLGVIIQAILRPNHDDLVAVIDLYDELLGRR